MGAMQDGHCPYQPAALSLTMGSGWPYATGRCLCYNHSSVSEKIVDRKALIAARQRLRDHGLRVVFTNGCFDLLHPGHVHYLTEARALGDALIVALNSDASVQRLK